MLGRNISFPDSRIGRTFTVNKIDKTGVTLTTYTRDYRSGTEFAAYGSEIELNSLLKGDDKFDYSFSLTFETDTHAADK